MGRYADAGGCARARFAACKERNQREYGYVSKVHFIWDKLCELDENLGLCRGFFTA